MPPILDIPLQRNEDWVRQIILTDSADQPLNLTGCTLDMWVKSRHDNDVVLAYADIVIVSPLEGELLVTLRASDDAPLASYGSPLQTVNLRYDMVMHTPDDINLALLTGSVILSRGVTTP